MTLTENQKTAFESFTTSVLEHAQHVVAANVSKRSKAAKAARRLERAGQHLVRAAHRTHGPADYHTVSEYERNEVILHYVIALEALLADEENLDLSCTRAASTSASFVTEHTAKNERRDTTTIVERAGAGRRHRVKRRLMSYR